MSEKLLRIPLSKLQAVRIICAVCKSAVEIPIGRFGKTQEPLMCLACPESEKTTLRQRDPEGHDEFVELGHIIDQLKARQRVDVEFVLLVENL